jgi:hypothetical protein
MDAKRQKVDDQQFSALKQRMKEYNFKTLDLLTTISPITDVVSVDNKRGDLDLVVASGNNIRSYVTFLKVISIHTIYTYIVLIDV